MGRLGVAEKSRAERCATASRKFWNPDSKFTVTDHQQALYQINSIMDDDQLGPKTVAMENGVYIISMPSPLESFKFFRSYHSF